MNVLPFIAAEQAGKHSVKRACELLEVSRSAYYERQRGKLSTRERVDQESTERILEVHVASNGTYGAPRIHAELADAGHRHGRKRIAGRMRAAGICGMILTVRLGPTRTAWIRPVPEIDRSL